jgi:uncharacterized protein (DUF885 family)
VSGGRLSVLARFPRHEAPDRIRRRLPRLDSFARELGRETARAREDWCSVPARRASRASGASAPRGYEQTGSLDGSRPGAYYTNLKDTAIWPKWTLATLTCHESLPGHLLRLTRALYAEQLADELGMYRALPLGHLEFVRLRASAQARLGDRFDLRAFHETALEGGAMPLEVLARVVDGWAGA